MSEDKFDICDKNHLNSSSQPAGPCLPAAGFSCKCHLDECSVIGNAKGQYGEGPVGKRAGRERYDRVGKKVRREKTTPMSRPSVLWAKASRIIPLNKTHLCVNLSFFSGISSGKRQNFDMMKSQLSFVDCFTALA